MTSNRASGPALVVRSAAWYFGLVFGIGFLLGVIRVAFLVPRLGERHAELLEMPIMFAAIVWSARHVVVRFSLPPAPRLRLCVGCLALALLVVAELALACALQRQTLADYIASRDRVSGSVYLAMLALFAVMPVFIRRR